MKATETLKYDTLLFIVEVRRDLKAQATKMIEYLRLAAPKHRYTRLQGLIIIGPRTASGASNIWSNTSQISSEEKEGPVSYIADIKVHTNFSKIELLSY